MNLLRTQRALILIPPAESGLSSKIPHLRKPNISGWVLKGGTQSPSELGTFEGTTIIPAGGYLVIGGENAELDLGVAPDVVFDFSLGNATSNTDGLQLVDCAGTVIDVVIYGESNDDGWVDEQGNIAVSFAPKPGDGASIGRLPDGVDTNDNGLDFSELKLWNPLAAQ